MNFLTMRLLQVLDDDTTFYLMAYILKKYRSICTKFITKTTIFEIQALLVGKTMYITIFLRLLCQRCRKF